MEKENTFIMTFLKEENWESFSKTQDKNLLKVTVVNVEFIKNLEENSKKLKIIPVSFENYMTIKNKLKLMDDFILVSKLETKRKS